MTASLPANIQNTVEFVQGVGHFEELRRRIRERTGSSLRTWDSLADLLKPLRAPAREVLAEYADELVEYGRKDVMLFTVDEAVADALRADASVLPSSRDWNLAPRRGKRALDPVYGNVSEDGSAQLALRSYRSVRFQHRLDPDELPEEVRGEFGEGAEFIVRATQRFVVFDWIRLVPGQDGWLIELRISNGFSVSGKKSTQSTFDLGMSMLGSFAARTGLDLARLGKPVDFFPVVQSLYNDKQNGGRVAELHFECVNSGAVRTERLRRKGRDKDLRTEAYHRAGVKADQILPYLIASAWPHVYQYAPASGKKASASERELVLPGARRMLYARKSGKATGGLFYCRLEKAHTPDDFALLIDALRGYVSI